MELGFEAVVIEDATRAINTNGSLEAAWSRVPAAGVQRMQLRDFSGLLDV